MKNTRICPKCGGSRVVRIPDHPGRLRQRATTIYTTRFTLLGKIPVIRYVCCDCGYAEDWVESPAEWVQLWQDLRGTCPERSGKVRRKRHWKFQRQRGYNLSIWKRPRRRAAREGSYGPL